MDGLGLNCAAIWACSWWIGREELWRGRWDLGQDCGELSYSCKLRGHDISDAGDLRHVIGVFPSPFHLITESRYPPSIQIGIGLIHLPKSPVIAFVVAIAPGVNGACQAL